MKWTYISPELVAEIKEYIKEDGLTVKEFAGFVGCSDSVLYYIFNDTRPLLTKYAVKISTLTGIDYQYILANSAFNEYTRNRGASSPFN